MVEIQDATQAWDVPGRALMGTAEAGLLAVGALLFLVADTGQEGSPGAFLLASFHSAPFILLS